MPNPSNYAYFHDTGYFETSKTTHYCGITRDAHIDTMEIGMLREREMSLLLETTPDFSDTLTVIGKYFFVKLASGNFPIKIV